MSDETSIDDYPRWNGRTSPYYPGEEYASSRLKRLLDIVGAAVLLACASPLLVVIGLLIALSGEWPLFCQRRYGRHKSTFVIYKLRSMRGGEKTFRQAVRGDSRVTRIGRVIRKTSIDELPQLVNVLRGEMSLVGPRPHPVELDNQYSAQIAGYDARFDVLPGLTGLAQVSRARGETPTVEHMRRRIKFDHEYLANASIYLDLMIISSTAKALVWPGKDPF